ncbi:hypothetical protein CHS0354_033102 [Potamilus streckersoni]|uniref:GAIN-B domain-containing protein n=1 Tax=Potamilus streckersoni TaxID=2493646 RepID=A0AAE0S629_9BIVA|nr:hypothetical protein CHS0354_033102 [Potamilus streckersoni]
MHSVSRLWDHGGCHVASWNASHTRCQCNHMTNFAVLMQVKDFEIGEAEKASLEVLTIMGCCGSIAALSATLVILFWLKLRSDRFILLMNLSTAIILAQIVFLVGVDATEFQVEYATMFICRSLISVYRKIDQSSKLVI